MSLTYTAQNYADFQVVIASAPFKIGTVYYCTSGGFFAVALAADYSSGIVGLSQASAPANFATDYPNAIQLAVAPVVGSNINLI